MAIGAQSRDFVEESCALVEKSDVRSERLAPLLSAFLTAPDDRIVGAIFTIGQNLDSFLASYDWFSENQKYYAIAVNSLADTTFNLDDTKRIKLLVNLLKLKGKADFSGNEYLAHYTIFNGLRTSVSDQENDECLLVSPEFANTLARLYSALYVSYITSKLPYGPKAATVISLLMFFCPDHKAKLCMLLNIATESHRLIAESLFSHEMFEYFANHDYLSEPNAEAFADTSRLYFWNLLQTFEEVLSYWLIVATDTECFAHFSVEMLTRFTAFLKNLSLTLLHTGGGQIFTRFASIKETSIRLLNQLYMKNLRIKFLPDGFWKLQIAFNIDSMIQCVLDDENNGNLSDEEPKRKFRPSEMQFTLEVLNKCAFFVDFKDRAKVFRSLVESDQDSLSSGYFYDAPKLEAEIRRHNLLEDAYTSYKAFGAGFKNTISVTFHNEHGVEAGIDGGGITKEFLSSVAEAGFSDSELGLFKETADNALYPNPDISLKLAVKKDVEVQQKRLNYIRFMGMVIGKCLYEGVLVDITFAPFFLSRWHGKAISTFDDLAYLDRDLYNNLLKLLNMTESEIKDLDLDFSITEQIDGTLHNFSLQPGSEPVTKANRLNYIHHLANFKLNKLLNVQTRYFLDGLSQLISPTWISMFDPFEVQMLISGGTSSVDVQDWRENVVYGTYFPDDPTVLLFWEVIEEMTQEERCKVLKFVTSVSRAPLLGFKSLKPHFGITNSGADKLRLPTASTCVNLLKLPEYNDKKLLREKLLYAISTNSGFDLL